MTRDSLARQRDRCGARALAALLLLALASQGHAAHPPPPLPHARPPPPRASCPTTTNVPTGAGTETTPRAVTAPTCASRHEPAAFHGLPPSTNTTANDSRPSERAHV